MYLAEFAQFCLPKSFHSSLDTRGHVFWVPRNNGFEIWAGVDSLILSRIISLFANLLDPCTRKLEAKYWWDLDILIPLQQKDFMTVLRSLWTSQCSIRFNENARSDLMSRQKSFALVITLCAEFWLPPLKLPISISQLLVNYSDGALEEQSLVKFLVEFTYSSGSRSTVQ